MPQTVKNPPAMQETRVPSLGQEDPLEKGMATHSRIPAWRIPWTEKPGRLKESDMTWQLNNNKQFMHTDLFPLFTFF